MLNLVTNGYTRSWRPLVNRSGYSGGPYFVISEPENRTK